MDNNDLLRRLRYALSIDDAETARLIKLGGGQATKSDASAWRAKENDDDFRVCDVDTVSCFLTGLITDRRGPPPGSANKKNTEGRSQQPPPKADNQLGVMDNNTVLKQLRIALSFRSEDIHEILKAGGCQLTASEIGAFFRKPDARNYRTCGDQTVRQFINGLTQRRDSILHAPKHEPRKS